MEKNKRNVGLQKSNRKIIDDHLEAYLNKKSVIFIRNLFVLKTCRIITISRGWRKYKNKRGNLGRFFNALSKYYLTKIKKKTVLTDDQKSEERTERDAGGHKHLGGQNIEKSLRRREPRAPRASRYRKRTTEIENAEERRERVNDDVADGVARDSGRQFGPRRVRADDGRRAVTNIRRGVGSRWTGVWIQRISRDLSRDVRIRPFFDSKLRCRSQFTERASLTINTTSPGKRSREIVRDPKIFVRQTHVLTIACTRDVRSSNAMSWDQRGIWGGSLLGPYAIWQGARC